jgi:hypothetical protein
LRLAAFEEHRHDDVCESIELVAQASDLVVGQVAGRRSEDLPAAVNGEHDSEARSGSSSPRDRDLPDEFFEDFDPFESRLPNTVHDLFELRPTPIVDEPVAGAGLGPGVEDSSNEWGRGVHGRHITTTVVIQATGPAEKLAESRVFPHMIADAAFSSRPGSLSRMVADNLRA